jgi:3-oxoacyl-[acyl-carrier protein] reductase
MLRVNLTGTFLCATRAARAILDGGAGGSIVTVSSALAFSGRPMRSAYTASKAGVVAMTKSLAAEWGPKGIRVNSVAPGFVDTPLVGNLDAQYRQAYSAQTPLRRVGTAVDVARVARFLLSDEAGYVTGQTILVNGGFLMPS